MDRQYVLFVVLLFVSGCVAGERQGETSDYIAAGGNAQKVPTGLALPFDVEDLHAGEMISPFGVIRGSKDGGIGHGGIDFTIHKGDPIYAVADGEIIYNEKEDGQGGTVVDILIAPVADGEGWIFKYEHIELLGELDVGSSVKKGEKIGESAIMFGNNHLGLEYAFNDYAFYKDAACWVSLVEPGAQRALEDKFEELRADPAFVKLWETSESEGYYEYKGLLDEAEYPNGPRLCYELGTDARVRKQQESPINANEPPLKLKSIGVDLDYYDSKTNRAGDFQFTKAEMTINQLFSPYGYIISGSVTSTGDDKVSPQPTFRVPMGTRVRSLVDGVVVGVPELYSGDYSVHVAANEGSQWIYETEHVTNVRVSPGDRVTAGQIIADVSPHDKDNYDGLGLVEIGILHGGAQPEHLCPFAYMDDSIKADVEAKILALYESWEEYRGDKSIYDNEASPGCVTHERVLG
ncbi:MAG: peptidoglycan DD-metalloendopeptidase family protein [Candidatus Aenigmatarchaeota archaeon]|nr:MAG: peptidoglycan DD-metalloendopeptidase family protein [Candidatus Aenigmarchaeota archaeon]